MSENSIEKDVLDELGDDKLQELAGLLGPDADTRTAKSFVGDTVSALSGGLQERAEGSSEGAAEVRQALDEAGDEAAGDNTLQGVSTLGGGLGGLLGGGMMAGVLSKLSRPVAQAVSRKTGIPAPTVARGIEMLVPVLLTVFAKRAAGAKKQAGAATSPGAAPSSGQPGAAQGQQPGAAQGQPGGGLDLGELLGQILGGKK
ncbi:DUF937 domain-containing protein [Streptomyces luteolus]|uniref:DUF937 domain-containing protein n=1 Tax=Streptomyces luteolus TaxID=3043615 RepID=A0ABT6SSF7_9ACTN|nr:DUF937 domain-containing protein [Streptomyces sp. B-S-A12]MDI3418534.1 DUF937 domain-containing protein [Streptomyces sp. B-S-A12]